MTQTDSDSLRQAVQLRATVQRFDRQGEIWIATALGAVAVIVIAMHLIAAVKTDWQSLNIWVVALLISALAICRMRIYVAKRPFFSEFWLGFLTVCEVGIFITLIWSYQYAHGHDAIAVLKAPSIVFLFVLVGVRALRFHPLPAIVAGSSVMIGWCVLAIGAGILTAAPPADGTNAYLAYVSGNSILVGAEIEKLIGFAGLTIAVTFSVSRARMLVQLTAEVQAQTEARKLEAEHLMQKAQAADRAKSNFLANMSHELRTPLNAVQGYSEMILHEINGPVQPEVYRGYVDNIHSSGTQLLGIVNDILDVSNTDEGTTAADEEMLNFESLVDQAVSTAGQRDDNRMADIKIDKNAPAGELRANRRHMKKMLANLIGNAIKFSQIGQPVHIGWKTENGGLTITIADSGIGISETDLKVIEQPFQQVEETYARNYGGVGLGLSIVRRIIDDHGGTLALSSDLGKGTLATIHIPESRWSPKTGRSELQKSA